MMPNEDKEKFIQLTKTMDIPELRREPNGANLRWFLRNAWIRNSEHINIVVATDMAKKFV